MKKPEGLINILGLGDRGGLRVDCKGHWDVIFNRLPYRPVAYSNASIDYQFLYQRGRGGTWHDLSHIIYWDDKPVALWPLMIPISEDHIKFPSEIVPVLLPMFVTDCPTISAKQIAKNCLNIMNSISIATKVNVWESSESFCNSVGMSNWHIDSMARGAISNLRHELFLDLRPDIAEIKRAFRKSYKSLISRGAQIWTIGVLDSSGDENAWQEFRELHRKVSGRVTRSDATWDLQYQHIKYRCAFLVWLKNSVGEMVGGGLFNFTGDEGVYAVGAYDRTLFSKPLGHVVQYRAIEELKNRGVMWYKIGARSYISDTPRPGEKEISISEFKQGFASHVFPQYHLTHKVLSNEIV